MGNMRDVQTELVLSRLNCMMCLGARIQLEHSAVPHGS